MVSTPGYTGLVRLNNAGFGVNVAVSGVTPQYLNSNVNDTNTHYFAGKYDGSNLSITVDKTKTNSAASGTPNSSGDPLRIGQLSSGAWAMDGKIDEVRVANVARTDGWLNTEYDNQNSPSTFSTGSAGGLYSWPVIGGLSSIKSMVGFGM